MSNTKEYLAEMDARVREIGKHLGMKFVEEYAPLERDWNYLAKLENGSKVISFYTDGYKVKDRWRIQGEFPRDNKGQSQTGYNWKRLEITVSMSKRPEKIAKDIKGRVLPEYEAQLVKVLERIKSANKYAEGRFSQICKVADFLGMERPADDQRAVLYPGQDKGVYRLEPQTDKGVKFEVECSADRAIDILKLLGYGK